MKHFIRRHISTVDLPPVVVHNRAEDKNNNSMDMNNENIERMENIANALTPEQTTKKIKKDKGLIERVESQKTMLTEDNKELLLG